MLISRYLIHSFICNKDRHRENVIYSMQLLMNICNSFASLAQKQEMYISTRTSTVLLSERLNNMEVSFPDSL